MVSTGSNSSRQFSEPWEGQQPYLRMLYERADQLFGQGPYEYGPGRVAPFDAASLQAFNLAEGRAGGTPLQGANRALTERTLRGDFLDPESNPYLQGYARHARRDFYTGVNALGSRLEAAGRTGGGTHSYGMDRAEENYGLALNDLYGGAYEAERGRQLQSQQTALALGEEDWRDINALRSVGQQREEQSQRYLDDLVARFQQAQYGSAEKLSEFANMIGQPVMSSRGTSSGSTLGIISCWVAAEFFGWFSDQWFAARRFVMERAPESFREFYVTHGRDLAAAIRRDPALAAEWRPVFEEFARRGA